MHYFDYNATTPLLPVAEETWLRALHEYWQNPSSPYRAAARVRNLLEASRERLALLLECKTWQIVFNSGATEGNNAILNYFAKKHPPRARVILSPIEHPCVREAAKALFPNRVDLLPVSSSGVVEVAALPRFLENRDVVLVSVMAANNETGVLQPWPEILEICRKKGVPYHCDASQWLGKLPLDSLSGSDFLTGCAHKFGGPKGVGFIKLSQQENGFTSLLGGEQENGHRSGTENYPAIAAMLAALKAVMERLSEVPREQISRRRDFEKRLCQNVPGTEIIGAGVDRLWNTVSAIMPSFKNTRWVARLDKHGFIVSTGSACAAGKEVPSHVLAAMGYTPEETRRVVRVSGGWDTAVEAWAALAAAFKEVWQELHTASSEAGAAFVIPVEDL